MVYKRDVMEYRSLQALFQGMTAPYLFIGSGMSRRYCGAPSWLELLKRLARETRAGREYPFKSYEAEEETGLRLSVLFPRIASKIEQEYNQKFYSGEIVPGAEHESVNYEMVDYNPFRRHLAALFENVRQGDLPADLQEELQLLRRASRHSINGVITTNYDCFIESVFSDFEVYIGQEDLLFSQATGYAEIYKIHGCCTKPSSMVLTAGDYEGFDRRKAYLVAKLLAIFLENPVIFMGYSCSDPNIIDIFETIAECVSEDNLEKLGRRIVIVEYDEAVTAPCVLPMLMSLKDKTLAVTQVKTGEYGSIFRQLLNVTRCYDPRMLRRMGRDVYRTVYANKPEDTVRVISDSRVFDSQCNFTGKVIVGFCQDNQAGHNVLTSEQVYRHVLFEDAGIEYRSFMESWLPQKMQAISFPVYFYVRQYREMNPDNPLPERVQAYLDEFTTFDSILGKKIRADRKKRQASTLEQIREEWDTLKNRYAKVLMLDREELENGRLRAFLQELLAEHPEYLSNPKAQYLSDLKRLIRLCDFLENGAAVLPGKDGGQGVAGLTKRPGNDPSYGRLNSGGASSASRLAGE